MSSFQRNQGPLISEPRVPARVLVCFPDRVGHRTDEAFLTGGETLRDDGPGVVVRDLHEVDGHEEQHTANELPRPSPERPSMPQWALGRPDQGGPP
jgi:hypothetical protein